MAVCYRCAAAADEDAMMAVLSLAFRREAGGEKFERDRAAFRRDPERFRVLEAEGRIVGALHIGRHRIQVGRGVVTKADVGEVAILPTYQGKGYGSRLMSETVAWMREAGFHLSRLGGYAAFYRRFGWAPFPRGFVEFPLSGLRSRGGFTDPEVMLKPGACPGRIRPYDPATDFEAHTRLYCAFNRNRTGARPHEASRPPAPDANWKPNPWRVVYEEAGDVLAFLFAAASGEDHTRFETRVSFQDGGVSPGSPEALGYLIRHHLLAAHRFGATCVSARLPLDPALYPVYRDYSLGFTPTLWQTTESSNMLQVIDFPGLVDALLPELQARLRDAVIPIREGGLCLEVNGQTVALCVRDGVLTQEPGDMSTVELDQDLFCLLLLGLLPVAHAVRRLPVCPPRDQVALLDALFPPQGTATGVWG